MTSSVGAAPDRLAVILSVAALALVQAGCGGGGGGGGTPCTVNGVTVSASPATIASGGTSTLSATLDASAACGTGLTWSATGGTLTPSVSDPTKATFTSTTSTTPVPFTIRATSVADTSKFGSVTVTVIPPATCTVTGVTVSANQASIPAGASTTLTATLAESGACSGALTWSVSSTNGTLTPSVDSTTATFTSTTSTSQGPYTITARSVDDPTKSGSAVVTVTSAVTCLVSGVIVSANPTTIPSGGTSALNATPLFTGSCTGAVNWTASGGSLTPSVDTKTATFTSTTSTSAITYTITATSVDDAGKSGTATVIVDPAVSCTVNSVSVSANPAIIAPGATSTLNAVLTASAGCNPALTWSIDSPSPPTGGTLTPNVSDPTRATFTSTTQGPYTITARSVADPAKFATATVTVLPACTVTSVTVSASPATITSGGTSTLSATLNANPSCSQALAWSIDSPPTGGTLTPSVDTKTATFTSTTSTTATIYTIRATSVADNTKFGTANVTVNPAVTCTVNAVTVSASPPSIPSGGTATLTATLDATAGCNTGFIWSASGGVLAQNGNSATFTAIPAAPPTTFTITATSVADNTKSGSATVAVTAPVPCGQPNGTEIIHAAGDRLVSETWAGDGVTHRVEGTIQIKGTAVLTVQACALVKLGVNSGIFTFDSGQLISNGTGAGRNVTFSSSSTTGLRWGRLAARSATSLVDLRFTTLREGGEQPGFFNSTLAAVGAGYLAPPAKVLRVISVAIEGSSGIGVYLGENAAFTDDSTALTIVNAASNPMYASMRSLGSLPAGSYTGNAQNTRKFPLAADEIQVIENGEVPADMTIKDLGVPYSVFVPSVNVRPLAPATAPVTLTLQPGVTMRFPRLGASPGALVTLGDVASGTAGVLNAVGTGAPIVFTSGQAVPAAGDWAGLWLANAPGSRLDNVRIEFAGAPNGITSSNCRPAGTSTAAGLVVGANSSLYVPPADLITRSTISSSAGHGISANWLAATTVNAPVLTTGNTFTGNGGGFCSQTFNGVSGAACPSLGCTTP